VLRLQFKIVVSFFAGVLLLAYTLPYLHQVASDWESLLAQCIPALLHQSREEDGMRADIAPDLMVLWHDLLLTSMDADLEVGLSISPALDFPAVSVLLNPSESLWARPPPAGLSTTGMSLGFSNSYIET
jgi:hypothetical protein